MLVRQIERVRRSRKIDRLVVATSTDSNDAAIAELTLSIGLDCHRGSLDDVLDRIYQAAVSFFPEYVVRLTGDCPLADWNVIDRVIDLAVSGNYDYASNTLKPTWPDGLDVEVAKLQSLAAAWREAKLAPEREHVTPFIYSNKARFKLGNLENEVDLAGLRWTVDEPADFAFVTRVYEALYPINPTFGTTDILGYLASHPEVVAINTGTERNPGFERAMNKLRKVTSNG